MHGQLNMIKKLFERITGIDKIRAKAEEEARESVRIAEEAKSYAEKAKRDEELAKMTPKERASLKGEPWVAVLETKVNLENPRNGFFELDWNEHFVAQLKATGYRGETDEEIVDDWFKILCRDIGSEDSIDMERRGSGYINVNKLSDGRSEIS